MKKTIAILLSLVFLCLLVSCGPKSPTKTPQEPAESPKTLQIVSGLGKSWEYGLDPSNYDNIIQVEYPYVNLHGADAEIYPRLKLALEDSYEALRLRKLDLLNDFKTEMEQDGSFPYQSMEKAYVRRADTKVLSILYDCYDYTGGMHGYSYFTTENYNTATGELLKLSDVITDIEALPDIIWLKLDSAYPDIPFWSEDVNMAELLEDDSVVWTLDYNGITFYFNPYTLAAYAYGRQQVSVSYSDFPELVKKEYQMSPESYGVELPRGCNFYYDVNSDGAADTISWVAYGDFEEQLTITLNGQDYEFDHYSFDTEVTFLAPKDGAYYLYVQTTVENDYTHTYFYRLGDNVEYLGEMAGSMRYYFHKAEDMYFTEQVLTNPDCFDMCTRTQMASTVTGYRTYSVGEDGMPKTNDPFYLFEEETMLTFTALRDFSAEIYDEENHTAKGTVKISAGETMQYYATDGQTYIWLLLEDGTLCRKKVQLEDYRLQIDGYYVEEMFEGVMYAG